MKKAFPLLFLLLSGICFAQTVCTNIVDQNGNVCTNFTTLGHSYNPDQTYFAIDSEDGVAGSGNVQPHQPYNHIWISIPYDPLKIQGLIPSYGDNSTSMIGDITNSVLVNQTANSYTVIQTFANIVDDVYTWSGTFTVTYTRQGYVSCGGRAHRSCPIYRTGPGVGVLSAVHN